MFHDLCRYPDNTKRSDFPTTPGAYDRSYNGSSNQWHGDGFVAKLSPDGGSFVYSTFIGGSDAEVLGKIVVDNEGCAYACFMTSSADNDAKKVLIKGLKSQKRCLKVLNFDLDRGTGTLIKI